MKRIFFSLVALVLFPVNGSGGKVKAAREVADFVLQKFGRESFKEGAVVLARRIETLAAKHGPEVFEAVKKVGPEALHLVERAGEQANHATGLLARFGDEAVEIVARPRCLALIAKYGDEAAVAMIRHRGIAQPIIESFGQKGAKALLRLNGRNGRRLAMLASDGTLAKIGKAKELLGVIETFGDRAMEFVWNHKGALAITAVLTAFLAKPEVFINGIKDITKIAGENVARPIAEVPGKVAVEAARQTNWTLLGLCGLVFVGLLVAWRLPTRR